MNLMTRDAGMSFPPISAPPVLDYRAATPRASSRLWRALRLGDRYLAVLCLALLGYALGGRGFAYWGYNPLFIGELMLVIGAFVLLRIGVLVHVLNLRAMLPLILFMCWGAACTIPHLQRYGRDAIRDAVVWGYGTYAFIVAGLLIASPLRLQKIVIYYRKFAYAFLILAPFFWFVCTFFEEQLPTFPGGHVPIIQMKGGDMCVHLAGVFSYVVALGAGMNPWIAPLFVPLNLGLNLHGRAGMVSFCLAALVSMLLRPFHPRAMRIFFVIALGLFLLWASDLRIEKGARELSFRQLIEGFQSIVADSDDEALHGSKEWRMKWWTDIVNYTVFGDYFWMGKGFGINLASDDGYQTSEDESLRSPHNGHMTMLARAGVPGFVLWGFVQGTWGILIVRNYFRARKRRHLNWSGVFMFLGCYWAAFMANTTFDVFIEGPMGGIWLWCIYGAGIGAIYLYRRYPDLLTPMPNRAVQPVGYAPSAGPA